LAIPEILLGIKYCKILFCVPYDALFHCSTKYKKFDSSATVRKNISLNLANGPFMAPGSHEWTTTFPSMELSLRILKYRFVAKIIFIL